MQRYRVNYTLLVGLVVGTLVLGGVFFGLWKWQVKRNANNLVERAAAAEASGDLRQAASLMNRYTRIRPDDVEGSERLAELWVEITKGEDADARDLQNAMFTFEQAVREQPQNDELRREFVDFSTQGTMLNFFGSKRPLDHINQLLNRNPSDTELQVKRAELMYATRNYTEATKYCAKLVGYDQSTKKFDLESAPAADQPKIYNLLAQMLRTVERQRDAATLVLEQGVKANPESAEAYYYRGLSRLTLAKNDEEKEAGRADLRKALELDPDDVEIIWINVFQVAAPEEDWDRAQQLIDHGIEAHPEAASLYRASAMLEQEKNKDREAGFEAAVAQLEKGIAAPEVEDPRMLMYWKAGLELDHGKRELARKSIEQLREKEFPTIGMEYLESRLLVSESRWYEGLKKLDDVQKATGNSTPQQMGMLGISSAELNMLTGLCHERLDQLDEALDDYRRVLAEAPDNVPAQLGRARVSTALGKAGEGATEDLSIQRYVDEELAKPEGSQDWAAVKEKIDKYAERFKLPEARAKVLWAETLLRRGKVDESKQELRAAYEMAPDDLSVQISMVRIRASESPTTALQLLDQFVARGDDLPIWRLMRSDVLLKQNPDDIAQELWALTEGIDSWKPEQKTQLYTGLSRRFESIGDSESANQLLEKVVELTPGDLATLVAMFKRALADNNDAGMKTAQERILKLVGSQQDPNYMFTEASRLTSLFRRGLAGPEALDQAISLSKKASTERPDWNEPFLALATVYLLQGNKGGALEALNKATERGRSSLPAVVQHVQLLVEQQRFSQAREVISNLNEEARIQYLGQQYATILANTGSIDEAVNVAKQFVEQMPDNAARQLWFGQLMAQVGSSRQLPEARRTELNELAGAALKKAVDISPESQETWLAWIGYLIATKQKSEAEEAVRACQLNLSEDKLTLILARCYETLGRWFDAENLYQKALEEQPDDLKRKRLLAAFYIGPGYNRPDAMELATPLINDILKSGEGEVEPEQVESLRWARREAAKILAASNDYQNLINAQNLLASNSEGGELIVDDKLLLAQILASRPEAASRRKAVSLLEDIKAQLDMPSAVRLGQLYFTLGNWDPWRQHMRSLTTQYPNSPEVRVAYMRMLLQRSQGNDLEDAEVQWRRLSELAPNSVTTLELLAQLSIKKGDSERARQALRAMFGQIKQQSINQQTVQMMTRVADMLVSLDDVKTAEQIYREIAGKASSGGELLLANFLGKQGDFVLSFEMLDKAKNDGAVDAGTVIQTGIEVARVRRDDPGFGDAQYDMIDKWLSTSLRQDPESISLLMLKADYHDLLKQYDEAAQIYRRLLARDDIPNRTRAIVLNNIAYMLALTSDDASAVKEAMGYVDQATAILGPQSDVLDTRAVVHIAAKQYSEAITDLDQAILDTPSASKYFHKAVAHSLANQNEEAASAWRMAIDLGLQRKDLSDVERTLYDQLRSKLEGAGVRAASNTAAGS